MKHKDNLGEDSIFKLMIRYSLPCILSLLISAVYNTVDQIFIGNSSLSTLGNAATGVVFPVLILFGNNDCNPCLALKNKIAKSKLNSNVSTYYLSLDENPDLASKLEIFSAPTLILFIAGKVALKSSGIFSLDEILTKVNHLATML